MRAYNRIRERGIKVSKVLLYALQGALLDVHWTKLDHGLNSACRMGQRLFSFTSANKSSVSVVFAGEPR